MASTSVCLASFRCRVQPSRQQRGVQQQLHLHLVIDHANLFAELGGSWLQDTLQSGLLDCGNPHERTRLPTMVGTSFEPMGSRDDSNVGEMFFVILTPDAFLGKDVVPTIPLQPCDRKLDIEGMRDAHGINLSWEGDIITAPPTLGAALAAASPRAAIVFQSSFIPDIGAEFMRGVSAWLRHRKINAAQRALVLHYRAGRLPSGWHERRTRASTRAHLGSSRGREGMPHESFWNNFWTMLVRDAQRERATELCAEQAGAACNTTRLLDRWCTTQRMALPPPPRPSPAKPLLLLGGDAHYAREYILYRLHARGVLGSSLWSLSTPAQCSARGVREAPRGQLPADLPAAGREAWKPFCAEFERGPKRIDRELSGPLEPSNKDMSFPPAQVRAAGCRPVPSTAIGESHRECPVECGGVPFGVPFGVPLECHWSAIGVPWSAMECHSECHGVPWSAMECHGVPWSAMECRGVPWSAVECHTMPSTPRARSTTTRRASPSSSKA